MFVLIVYAWMPADLPPMSVNAQDRSGQEVSKGHYSSTSIMVEYQAGPTPTALR
jgi:hypothetical protein